MDSPQGPLTLAFMGFGQWEAQARHQRMEEEEAKVRLSWCLPASLCWWQWRCFAVTAPAGWPLFLDSRPHGFHHSSPLILTPPEEE